MESSLGVTAQQRLVIRIVGRLPGISAGRLAKVLHVHPSTLTGLVKRLDKKGMIERRADPSDGRCTLLCLSRKGRLLDVETEGTVEEAIRRALQRLAPGARAAARETLAIIASTLDEYGSGHEGRAHGDRRS
jgi:DNA-binding MarR family transcriptional regulator